jgi:hypothetical protein
MNREIELGSLSRAEQAMAPREPDGHALVTLTAEGITREITVECYGKSYPRIADTRSSPGQPGGFVVDEVKYQGTWLTHLFTQDQLDAIAREIE